MSIWGKVIGGVAGFAMGGPLGALVGAFAGHAMDKMKGGDHAQGFGGGAGVAGSVRAEERQVAFTLAVIALSAKMAKADGQVTRDEVNAFKDLFRIPPSEAAQVARIFDRAKVSTAGYEMYAQQVANLFPHEPNVLEELLGGLFHIAKADGEVHPSEMEYLWNVAQIFGFGRGDFERITATHGVVGGVAGIGNAYEVLGVARDAPDAAVKAAYRKLIQVNHPDKLMAQGLPQEFIDLANEKMASINAAYDAVKKERGLT